MKYFIGEWYADCAIMYDYIDEMEVVSGTDRNKIHYVSPKIGGSNLFGYTWRSYLSPTRNRTPVIGHEKLWYTKLRDMYPEFEDVAKEFRDLHFPNFKYSQIQINKNYSIGKHFDSKNQTESVLCVFGDFIGGKTCIDSDGCIIKIDARDKRAIFDGSKHEHWVEPFVGKRYSLVFFHTMKKRPELLI
tara:strand:- start:76 stop:639 length:564 start_codon:yes stop_codon:yes gene_type:complete